MSYIGLSLEDSLHIEELFTIHYFEYTGEFHFSGESHDFWEFICVDKGSVNICMDEKQLTLHKGEIAFHQPNEFHNVSTYSQIAPNLVVVSFKCDSPLMDFFREKVLKIDEKERSLLAKILVEAQNLFETPLNNPYTKEMLKKRMLLSEANNLFVCIWKLFCSDSFEDTPCPNRSYNFRSQKLR